MLAFHLLSREKIRLFVKSWSSENNEMLAYHLLSREKIDQRANFISKSDQQRPHDPKKSQKSFVYQLFSLTLYRFHKER